jgi:hypothetical protein
MRPSFPIEPAAPAPSPALLRRFDRPSWRNPALPSLACFKPAFGASAVRDVLARWGLADGPARRLPWHLSMNLPCEACPDSGLSPAALVAESRALAEAIGPRRTIRRVTLHRCGNSPAGGRRPDRLLEQVAAHLPMADSELSVETPWPGAPALQAWRAAGVSSLVLEAPCATQIEMARALGFRSVTARIACGGREQDAELLPDELRSMMDAGVTRVELRPCAWTIEAAGLRVPDAAAPVRLFGERGVVRARAIATLQQLGLRHVGLGLFARADDPLVLAREHGRLHLEIDGLSAGAAAGTLALGAGAFGRVGSTYYRNTGGARDHAGSVALEGLSAAAGCTLSAAAQARRSAVASLICHGRLDFEALSLSYLVEPRRCFARALRDMAPLVRAGLVDMDSDGIDLTPQGEHLVEVVAAVFDPGP